jgi:LysM repeat protein
MGYWGWRPLISTLFICVWVSGCSLSSATSLVVSPTSLPRITLTLRVREARAPTITPTPPVTTTLQAETPAPAQYYTVRPGDTLLGIAIDFGLHTEQIKAANPGLDPHALQVGQQILLPQPGVPVAAAATPLPVQLDPPTCFDLITGSLLCIGQVRNQHDQPVTGVRVLLRLLGVDGEVLAETSTGVEQTIILPGLDAPYSAIFETSADVRPEAVLLNVRPATGQEVLPLDVVTEQAEISGSRYHVTASIVNTTGVATRPPRIVLTVVDSDGHLAGYRVMMGRTGLEPGAHQMIEIDAQCQPATGELTHHLYVEAYPS